MKRFSFFILTGIAFLISAAPLSAQTIPTTTGIDLSVSINNPAPGQSMTITAASYSADINSAKVTWSSAGKVLQSGIGLTTLTVNAPALGKKMPINVTMVTTEGITFSSSITLGSGSVDLIVEADGYTPPFFAGKLPVTFQNSINVVAIPHLANSAGVEYDPKTLVYKWQRNTQAIADQSGYGKQSITQPGDLVPRPYTIHVDVSTRDGNSQISGSVAIVPEAPSTAFYVNDALYGPLYNHALGNNINIGSQKETNILAVPYGFNARQNNLSNLSLVWLINGVEHPELATSPSVVLRVPDGTSGQTNIELDIENTFKILQKTSSGFLANFNTAPQAASAVSGATF